MLKPHNHPVESHGRTALRNYIIQASTLLEITLSGLVLIGLLFSIVPLLKWMPGLLFRFKITRRRGHPAGTSSHGGSPVGAWPLPLRSAMCASAAE